MSNDTCYLVIKFVGDENNWIHPISLNGRVIEAMYVDGVQVEPIRECDLEHVKGGPRYDVWRFRCCGYTFAESVAEYSCNFNHCPNCGAKVVSVNGE